MVKKFAGTRISPRHVAHCLGILKQQPIDCVPFGDPGTHTATTLTRYLRLAESHKDTGSSATGGSVRQTVHARSSTSRVHRMAESWQAANLALPFYC